MTGRHARQVAQEAHAPPPPQAPQDAHARPVNHQTTTRGGVPSAAALLPLVRPLSVVLGTPKRPVAGGTRACKRGCRGGEGVGGKVCVWLISDGKGDGVGVLERACACKRLTRGGREGVKSPPPLSRLCTAPEAIRTEKGKENPHSLSGSRCLAGVVSFELIDDLLCVLSFTCVASRRVPPVAHATLAHAPRLHRLRTPMRKPIQTKKAARPVENRGVCLALGRHWRVWPCVLCGSS